MRYLIDRKFVDKKLKSMRYFDFDIIYQIFLDKNI